MRVITWKTKVFRSRLLSVAASHGEILSVISPYWTLAWAPTSLEVKNRMIITHSLSKDLWWIYFTELWFAKTIFVSEQSGHLWFKHRLPSALFRKCTKHSPTSEETTTNNANVVVLLVCFFLKKSLIIENELIID